MLDYRWLNLFLHIFPGYSVLQINHHKPLITSVVEKLDNHRLIIFNTTDLQNKKQEINPKNKNKKLIPTPTANP